MTAQINNYPNIVNWLKTGHSISLKNDGFVKDNWKVRLKKFFNPNFRNRETLKVIDYINGKFKNTPEPNTDLVKLGNAFILKHRKSKKLNEGLLRLDHLMGNIRASNKELFDCERYLMKTNKIRLNKWQKASQNEEIFYKHYDFIKYLFETPLASQIKVTRDVIKENEDGEPVIPVEIKKIEHGELVTEIKQLPFSEFQEHFNCVHDKKYGEKVIVDKVNNIYTYLDTRKGMVMHDPYEAKSVPPPVISQLSQQDYAKTLEVARKFIRKDEKDLSETDRKECNKNRNYILQIVSSYVKSGNNKNPITGNFNEFVKRRKHPYLRIITPEGKVYEGGFGWRNSTLLIFSMRSGQFRTPDIWEYKSCDERVVTNIAIDDKEKDKFYQFVMGYHNKIRLGRRPAFNLLFQNCSVFVRKAVKFSTDINLPTEMSVNKFLNRIAPTCIQIIGEKLKNMNTKLENIFIRPLPQCLKKGIHWIVDKIKKIWQAIHALILSAFAFVLGGAIGRGGEQFRENENEPERQLNAPLANPEQWINRSKYTFNFPGLLQEWQRKQPSTIVYEKPVRFTIVPKELQM